jgi:hypothetical protein
MVRIARRISDGAYFKWRVDFDPRDSGCPTKAMHQQNVADTFGLALDQIEMLDVTPESLPALTIAPPPSTALNVAGFKAWLKANMTLALRNLVARTYPNFLGDLNAGDWADFQAGCNEVRATLTLVQLSAGQWTAFKNACATYNIPVTLT